ncbi:hypothetical protein QYE76_050802 [Lolium multiflorum]|uniref:Transposase (putative) gypsy type domain-containing protein n=1 Tax=Lolium multiflorum TaxID=4521 RepID=A0AAD8SSK4_LOLMU|nr:hypothetical protein QYE76_050802 [Lolium multiflorum]
MTKAWVERGLSLPCSEFFLSVLDTYGLQPHNICPNSYLLLSNFATLCEGHLGIRPDVKLWQFFPSEEGDEGQGHAELREHDFHAPSWPLTLWRKKTYAPYSEFLLAVTRWKRIRKTLRRKKNECPERLLLDLQSVPAPKSLAPTSEAAVRLPPRNPRWSNHLRLTPGRRSASA